ncbi:unnamed protein product [Nezara viridula]|uniref:Ribonuclease H2 subunit B n=1 Tax=Nezara viridula TaxID=85310 RepID=A0A9P0HCX8_NEZVI|nr:unnamed protein product [Nezara viridula]
MSKTKSVQKDCSKSCCSSPGKSLLFIVKEFGESESNQPAHVVRLRHPRTGEGSLFLISPENKVVHEILTFQEPKRSYFIGNEVQSDGRYFLSTPVDPLFLALPYLKEYGRCSPLDHIITDDEYPETERLLTCSGLKYIHHIADKKGEDSLNAYIYNEEKALKWLEKKVRRAASILNEKGHHVASHSVVSANFVINKEGESEDSYLRYACGLVSDYLPESLSTALESHLKLPSTETEKKRKNPLNGTPLNGENHRIKKKKVDEDDDSPLSSSPATPIEKKATPSAKEKRMAKAATGSKNITSFFMKK